MVVLARQAGSEVPSTVPWLMLVVPDGTGTKSSRPVGADQLAHRVDVADAGDLDDEAVRALRLDDRLGDAELVDAVLDDRLIVFMSSAVTPLSAVGSAWYSPRRPPCRSRPRRVSIKPWVLVGGAQIWSVNGLWMVKKSMASAATAITMTKTGRKRRIAREYSNEIEIRRSIALDGSSRRGRG